MQTNRAEFELTTSETLYCQRFEGGCPTRKYCKECRLCFLLQDKYSMLESMKVMDMRIMTKRIKKSGMRKDQERKTKKEMLTKTSARLIWTKPSYSSSLNL